jgi:hypothetical protein
LQAKTLEFDWRFDITVTEMNEDRDPKSWKTFCYNGCPVSSNYIPDKGLEFQYTGMTWKCKIESKEDTLQTPRTPELKTFSELRSFECKEPKSETIIRGVLSCEKDAKSGRKFQPDKLGYNFEKINIQQKVKGKWYELGITIECK